MQRHLDAGDRVTLLGCDSRLLACRQNTLHHYSDCLECIDLRRSENSLLSSPVPTKRLFRLSAAQKKELRTLKHRFSSLDELREYTIDNFDIGDGVLSSLISRLRDPNPDIDAWAALINTALISAWTVYRSVQNYLDQTPTDRVYTFNGRHTNVRAVLRACQSRNVLCVVHEVGQDIQYFGLYENTMRHDIEYVENAIRAAWIKGASDPQREAIASQWFTDRAKAVPSFGWSWVKDQQEGLLPKNWDPSKKNIAIFNSSEDEFEALGAPWRNHLYQGQTDGLQRIIQSLSRDHSGCHVYLRIHPNLGYSSNAQTDALARLDADFLTVIPATDPTSTYSLIRAADVVVTFGSTVGIEAVFWGKPSILAGRCYWQRLGGTYNPASHDELMELLRARLPAKDKTAALMYGYYKATFGIRFKYYSATELNSGIPAHYGTFAGRNLGGRKLVRQLAMFLKPTESRPVRHVIDRLIFGITEWLVTGRGSIKPATAVCRYWLGWLHLQLHMTNHAEAQWVESSRLAGSYVQPLIGLASLKLRHGDIEAAIAYARRARRMNPEIWKRKHPILTLSKLVPGLVQAGELEALRLQLDRYSSVIWRPAR